MSHTKRFRLSNEVIATHRWQALEINDDRSDNDATLATVAKSAADTIFRFLPGATNSTPGDFPAIADAKTGWRWSTNTPPAILETTQGTVSGYNNIHGSAWFAVGQRHIITGTVTAVTFWLFRSGSPAGDYHVRLIRVSDDEVLAEKSYAASSLPTGDVLEQTTTFTTPVSLDGTDVRIVIWYEGGDSSNYLRAAYTSNQGEGNLSYKNSTGWTEWTTTDAYCVVHGQIRNDPGSFEAGNWTFATRLVQTTKNAWSGRPGVRLSKSKNADGSNATLIGTYNSATITNFGTTAGSAFSNSWTANPGKIELADDEYLFIEFCITVTTAGSSTGCQCALRVDGISYLHTSVKTTAWTYDSVGPEGGSDATVRVIAEGIGRKGAIGSADATVRIIAEGVGRKGTVGSSEVTIRVVPEGAGQVVVPVQEEQGSSETTIVVSGEGSGLKEARAPPAEATVNVESEGTGTKGSQGSAETTIEIDPEGSGQSARAGGAETSIEVNAEGSGQVWITVITEPATDVTAHSARIHGSVTLPEGGDV